MQQSSRRRPAGKRSQLSKALACITRLCIAATTLTVAGTTHAAQHAPPWLRDPAVSPDGRSIAFRLDGDIYVASTQTGRATILRGTAANERQPVWFADGKKIAFSADTFGSFDVFAIDVEGGADPQRLTWHCGDEVALGVAPDGLTLLIRANRIDVSASPAVYPADAWQVPATTVYSMSIHGGMPRLLAEPTALEGTWAGNGRLIFSARASNEMFARKHASSPATSDLWLQQGEDAAPRKLTTFDGHDTAPVWNATDGHVYYLSERGGSANIWRMPLQGDSAAQPVTRHTQYPVRDLSISAAGRIAYSYRGEIYVGAFGIGFRKLHLEFLRPRMKPAFDQRVDASTTIRQATLIPDRQEAVLVVRGEIYAVDIQSGARRRLLAEHAGVKSWPTFSVDGRSLLVVRDRGDMSDLLLAQLPRDAHSWVKDALTASSVRSLASTKAEVILRSSLSPDGERAAFTTGMTLRVVDVATGKLRDLLRRGEGLETTEQPLVWHPGSAHLAIEMGNLRRTGLAEIAVVRVADGTLTNISRSGFNDRDPQWSRDGRALIWQSDRDGLRNFGPQDATADSYAFFFDSAAQRAYEAGSGRSASASAADIEGWLSELRHNPDTFNERRVRLSPSSAHIEAHALRSDGRALIQVRRVAEATQLWRTELPDSKVEIVKYLPEPVPPSKAFVSVGSIELSADGKYALVSSTGQVHWVDLTAGTMTRLSLGDIAAADIGAEQRWIFDHVIRTIDRVYYQPQRLQSGHWSEQIAEHRRFLPAIRDRIDFSELMSELLGELNTSHTFFRYMRSATQEESASLGVIYDPDHAGPGWKIAALLPRSPLAKADVGVRPGDLVTRIEGQVIAAGADPAQSLSNAAGKILTLMVQSPNKDARTVRITPVSNEEQTRLAYLRWADWRRRETERLSQGRLGYVHLASMEEEPFRELVDQILGSLVHKEGIVVDTRYNRGGWMHEPFMAFFSAAFDFNLRANGTIYSSEPVFRAGRPWIMLANPSNYSNGSEITRLVQEHGLAKLVGEPVAGTGMGQHADPLPYWEYQYGAAFDASMTADGRYWEGVTQHPDVLVPSDRSALSSGRDMQLEAAVSTLLEALR